MKSRLGDFELAEPMGSGGHGSVYRAVEHLAPGVMRPAAVKILNTPLHDDQSRLEAWRREVEVLADIGACPNFVTIFGCGVDDEIGPWLAMELAGQSLRDLMTNEPADPEQVRVLLRDILRALSVIHGREPQVLHRDLKPSNILAGRFGNWQLADFGLARLGAADDTLDLLTVRYAAPELLDSTLGPETAKVDLYSLGMIAYEVALGHALFRAQFPSIYDPDARAGKGHADERPKWMYWHTSLQMPLAPVASVIKDYPQDLSDLISALTAKPLRDRIESARDALARLGDVVATIRPGATERAMGNRSQSLGPRTLLLAAGTVVLVIVVGFAAYLAMPRRPRIDLAGDGHFSGSAPELVISGMIDRFPRGGTATVVLADGSRHVAQVADDGGFTAQVSLQQLGDADASIEVSNRSDRVVAKTIARLDRTAPESVRLAVTTVPPVAGAEVVLRPRSGAPVGVRTSNDGSVAAVVPYGSFEFEVDHPRFERLTRTENSGIDPERTLRARLAPISQADLVAKRDQALDEIDGLIEALGEPRSEAVNRLTALHTLLSQLERDSAGPAGAPIGNGAPEDDADSIQRRALLGYLGELSQRIAAKEPGAAQRVPEVTEKIRELDPPLAAPSQAASDSAHLHAAPGSAESVRLSSAHLSRLSLAQFKSFIQKSVPAGALTISALAHLGKVRVQGPVFNQDELEELLERLAIAAPRLELDVHVDPWALCHRLERAMTEHGASDARAVAMLTSGAGRLLVQFDPTGEFDRAAATRLSQSYVLDDRLLLIQDYIPSAPAGRESPAGR